MATIVDFMSSWFCIQQTIIAQKNYSSIRIGFLVLQWLKTKLLSLCSVYHGLLNVALFDSCELSVDFGFDFESVSIACQSNGADVGNGEPSLLLRLLQNLVLRNSLLGPYVTKRRISAIANLDMQSRYFSLYFYSSRKPASFPGVDCSKTRPLLWGLESKKKLIPFFVEILPYSEKHSQD